ncbi:MAG TPA: hypothetical protein VKW04_20085 [Planctomycetota bacterium]|nr:hypothetical protein [Planctomycetota bacterium]
MPRLVPPALGLLAFLLAASSAGAVDKTWTGGTTAWNTAGNWSPVGVPGAADRAIIPNLANKPVVSVSTTINQLQVQAGSTVTINTAVTLTVAGGASPVIDGTGSVITAGTGLLAVSGGPAGGTLINSSMTLGNFMLSAAGTPGLGIPSGNTVTGVGTWTINTSDLQLGTAGGAAATLAINGNLVINAGGALVMRANADTVSVSGNWTQAGRFTCGTGSTVLLNGTTAQTFTVTRNVVADVTFANLRNSNTGGVVTYLDNPNLATGFVVANSFTLDAATTTLIQEASIIGTTVADTLGIGSGATLTFTQRFDPDCTIAFDIDAGAQDGTLVLQGTGLPPADSSDFGFALRAAKGTVRIEVSQGGTFNVTNGGPYSFYNLVFNTTSNPANQVDAQLIPLSSGITVLNTLALTRVQLQLGAFTVNVKDVTSGISTQSQLDLNAVGAVFRATGNVTLGSFSQVAAGTTGPFGLIVMSGTTPQTFQILATTASQYFDLDSFQVSNPAGVTVLDNPNADFLTNGTLTIDANCTLIVQDAFNANGPVVFGAGGGNVLRLENSVIGDGTPMGTAFTAGTGTVVYASTTVAQTVYATTNTAPIAYYNLTIDNAGQVATQEAAPLTVTGSFTIQTATASFTATSNGMTVSQNFIANGIFTNGGGTVTMNGTGSIGGTSASLVFNNLLVSGATTSVVTAARSFSTAAAFQVTQGTLTTAGLVPGITMTAAQGMTAGDGAGAAGTGVLTLVGPDTLAIAGGRTFSVNATDGRFTSVASAGGNPTLTRSGAGTFTATVNGQCNLFGLNFSFADSAGLNITGTATLERLRNVRFTNVNAAAGSRDLTIAVANLNLDCPGCFFDTLPAGTFNVQAKGAGTNMRLRFENRGPADVPLGQGIGGPGAGDAFNNDDDLNSNGVLTDAGEVATGSIVQWVYSANIDMQGSMRGALTPAFDWNTFSFYATYAVMNQGAGTSDTIYVLNPNGDLQNYSFSPGAAAGNISGILYWDTEGTTHVVYFGTTTGLVYKLIDTGSALVPPASPDPWNTPYSDTSLKYVSTSIMSDRTNLYFGGNDNLNPGNSTSHYGMYRLVIATKTQSIGAINLQRAAVVSDSSWADTAGGRMMFQASGTAANGSSAIYRVRTTSWIVDTQVAGTSAFTGATNVPLDTLFVGEANGRMHAVAALGTAAQFVERTGFPFTVNTNAVAGGAIWDMVNAARLPALTGGRIFFGTATGDVFALYLYPATWTLGTNYYRVAPAGVSPIQSQPLSQNGILYVSNSNGKLYVFDADGGAGPVLLTTYTLFGNAATGDISRDSVGSGRIYVGTSAGRVYSITPPADPTPSIP